MKCPGQPSCQSSNSSIAPHQARPENRRWHFANASPTPQQRHAELQPFISESRRLILEHHPFIAERRPVIAERRPVIAERRPVIAERRSFIVERRSFIVERRPFVVERSPFVVELRPFIAELRASVADPLLLIAERDGFKADGHLFLGLARAILANEYLLFVDGSTLVTNDRANIAD
jgi:hypothetical protein